MNRSARLYINVVLGFGCLMLALALVKLRIADPALYALLSALAITGAALKMRVPGIDGNISISFPPMVLCAVLCSLEETVLLAAVATFVQANIKVKKRKPLQIAFNCAALALSGAASALAASLVAGQGVPLVQIALAGMASYVVNSALIATVIGLVEERPLLEIWNECVQSYLPFFAAGLSCAAMALSGTTPDERRSLQYPGLAVLPLMLLVRHYFKTFVLRGAGDQKAA